MRVLAQSRMVREGSSEEMLKLRLMHERILN